MARFSLTKMGPAIRTAPRPDFVSTLRRAPRVVLFENFRKEELPTETYYVLFTI